MDKNTIWAIVLSTIIIVGFMFLQPILNPQQKPAVTVTETAVETQVVPSEETVKEIQAVKVLETTDKIEEKQYEVLTNKAKVVFTNRGGDIISYELLEHKSKDVSIQMADSISEKNRAFSVAFGDNFKEIDNSVFNVKQTENKIEFYKSIFVEKADGSKAESIITKTYTFLPDEYLFKLEINFDNKNGVDGFSLNKTGYTLRTSPQIGPHYDKKKDRYEYRRFLSYSNNKQKRKQLGENATDYFDKDFTWTGVAGKYFSVLVKPEYSQNFSKIAYSTVKEVNDYANAQVMLVRKPVGEQNIKDVYYVYIGPQTEKSLAKYNVATENEWNVSGFNLNDSLSSSGILSWLEAALKWVMELMHDKLHINWGLSIIIMTLLLKLVMFPLTKKSSISTLKMQKIQPQMTELQTKYKGNPEKLNLEMAKLYKEMGYNPMSGCLPLLLQFPLIIAMFNLFNNYFEFRGAPFIPGWIPDLSIGDSLFTLSFSIPFIGNELRLLPILYVISQLFYGKITQTNNGTNATQMKFMMYGMPLMFFFIFYNAPSGLLIYWIVSNLLQLIQQIFINKMMKEKREEMGLPAQQKTVNTQKKK